MKSEEVSQVAKIFYHEGLESELSPELPGIGRSDAMQIAGQLGMRGNKGVEALHELWDAGLLARYRDDDGYMRYLPRTEEAILRAIQAKADQRNPDRKTISRLNQTLQEVRDND